MKKILWWKQIDELKDELRQSKRNEKVTEEALGKAKKQIDKLKSMLRGERVCDGYCEWCEHAISKKTKIYTGYGVSETSDYTCSLDCKCPDFTRKEQNA